VEFLFIAGCGSRICQLRLPADGAVHYPYATQEGEISFCAYNRRGLAQHHREDAHDLDADQWYERAWAARDFRGRKKVKIEDEAHALYLRDEIVTHEVQHDLR